MLTDKAIRAAEIKSKAYKLSDSGGLYLHIKPNGNMFWRLKFRYAGKEKLLSLGRYGSRADEVSLKDARSKRDEARLLLRDGVDPSEKKRTLKQKQINLTENTFQKIAYEWLEKKKGVIAEITFKRHTELLVNDVLPYIGSRSISELETFELVECLERISERGALSTSHKARQQINQVFLYALQTGRIKYNPASNMGGAIQPLKKSHMPAITDPKEFGKMLRAIEGYQGSHIIRVALRLAPLLFQRPGELCAMEWCELDLDNAKWTIPKHKKKERNQTEGDHIVPLSTQAVVLINDIKPLTSHGRFVFPNQRDKTRPIRTESLGKALRNIGIDTKTQHCTHGFRASARTLLDEQLQLRVEWIEQQLAHNVKDPLGRAYNRTKHLPERVKMMQKWADYLDRLKAGA